MKKALVLIMISVAVSIYITSTEYRSSDAEASSQTNAKTQNAPAAAKTSEDPEFKRQQLNDREAALAAKEQELKKLSASLDSRIKELTDLKKEVETSLQQKSKQDEELKREKFRKMLRVYKSLKPAEAGNLMDQLDENLVIEMLNNMDQKTAVKLVPFLSQPRVIKWTKMNLKGN